MASARRAAHRQLRAQATARAGVEAATLDALTRGWGVPLYQFFGGSEASVTSDLSIPIAAPEQVARLAQQHSDSGARTLKLKVGTTVAEDLDRVWRWWMARPRPRSSSMATRVIPQPPRWSTGRVERENVRPILLEQPTHRHDLEGLRFVTERAGIPVAADEAVHTAADALRVARMGAANVVNIKLMKSGVVEAMDIAAVCRAAHIDLMIGAMIESRLGSAVSAHLAAGLGGFTYIDLDIPMLLAEDPFTGGYTQDGMEYRLDPAAPGHGVGLASS